VSARGDIEDQFYARQAEENEKQQARAGQDRYNDLLEAAALGKRLADEDLSFLLRRTEDMIPDGSLWMHATSRKVYQVVGTTLRHPDLRPSVSYRDINPMHRITFNRDSLDFLAKFAPVREQSVWVHKWSGELMDPFLDDIAAQEAAGEV
jgi:hypothetical protein